MASWQGFAINTRLNQTVTGGRRDENENESERQTSGTQTGFRGGQKAGGPETGVGSARVQDGRLQLYIRRSVRRHTSYLRGSLSKIGHEAHIADARARLLHDVRMVAIPAQAQQLFGPEALAKQ